MKVVIAGAGIAGLSAAYVLSTARHDVTVIDPNPRRAAARVAAGRLAPVTETEFGQPGFIKLCLAASQRWESWAQELSQFIAEPSWYQRSGMIVPARHADDSSEIARLADYQTSLGLDVEALSRKQARVLEPALSPSIRGGLLVRGDHQVDNRALLDGLRTACQNRRVQFITDRVTGVGTNKVEAEKGVHQADAVIVAAGAWTSQIGLPSGMSIDVHPIKGQIIRLQTTPRVVFPSYPIDGLEVYLVPRRNGELVVGASVEDVGFDPAITAGAVHDLLRRARELVPGVDEMEMVESSVGFRPATRNHQPIIGPLSPNGPFVAAGLYRNGILLSPLVADSALDWIQQGESMNHHNADAASTLRTTAANRTAARWDGTCDHTYG